MASFESGPKPAATIVLLRQASELEVFLMQRSATGFMAGAHVFPGGKLDPRDQDPETLRHVDLSSKEAARILGLPGQPELALGFFVAALRETYEEAGVLLASEPDRGSVRSHSARYARLRRRMLRGELSFQSLLQQNRLTLLASRLHYFAHWITPPIEQRRYDTRFFLAQAPLHASPTHDQHETVQSCWLTIGAALQRALRQEMILPPPTMKTLELLSGLRSIEDAFAWEKAWQPVALCPAVHLDDDGSALVVLPGHPRSTLPSPVYPGPTAYRLRDGYWVPEPHVVADPSI